MDRRKNGASNNAYMQDSRGMVNKSNVSVRSSQDSKRGTLYESHKGMNVQGRNEWQVKSSQSVIKLQK